MQIQFNTDESIEGREALGRHAADIARKALDRFSAQVTRVEIHVRDVNGDKPGDDDKQCLMEARIAGRRPISVRDRAGSLHQALDGAARKMERRLASTLGKLVAKRRETALPSV